MQHHETLARENIEKTPSNRAFGLTFAAFFLLVAVVRWSAGHGATAWWFGAALVATITAWLAPQILAPLNRLWIKLGLLLYRIVNPIILFILFYGVITPFGIVARLVGKKILDKGFNRVATSYWIKRDPPGPPPSSMRRQF